MYPISLSLVILVAGISNFGGKTSISSVSGSNGHYGVNLEGLENLARADFQVAQFLIEKLKSSQNLKLNKAIKKYIRQIWEDIPRRNDEESQDDIRKEREQFMSGEQMSDWWIKKRSKAIADNPVSVFRLLYRWTRKLSHFQEKITKLADWNLDRFLPKILPDEDDLQDAIIAILDLIQLYKIPIEVFARGELPGISTGVNLTVPHCSLLGQYAKEKSQWSLAIQWYFQAYKISRSRSKSTSTLTSQQEGIKMEIEETITDHDLAHPSYLSPDSSNSVDENKVVPNDKIFKRPIELPISDGSLPLESNYIESFETLLESIISKHNQHLQEDWNEKVRTMVREKNTRELREALNYTEKLILFKALCAGDNFQTEKEKSGLFCWYESRRSFYYWIGPMKMELLSTNPDVVQIYDVVGPQGIQKLENQIPGQFIRGFGTKHHKDGKTSKIYTRSKVSMDVNTESIDFGILMTHMHTIPKFMPVSPKVKLGMRHYAFGGQFLPHIHFYVPDQQEKVVGPNFVFYIVYLSHETLGGGTAFPILGMSVKPAVGSAVYWFDVLNNEVLDEMVLHGGCPILHGRKLTASREHQMWNQFLHYKCSKVEGGRFRALVNGKLPPDLLVPTSSI